MMAEVFGALLAGFEREAARGATDDARRAGRSAVKPLGPVARRADYIVQEIDHDLGVQLFREHHYARGCSNTGIMHGLIRRSDRAIVGAACWLPPTRVCAESVSRDDWRNVLSLSRLAVVDGEPKNCASLLIAGSIRLLPPRWRWLVTFADESQGHTGTIYRATGWRFVGRTKPEARWIDTSGRQVSKKSAGRSRTNDEMRALGLLCLGRFTKLKFTLTRGEHRGGISSQTEQHLAISKRVRGGK